MDTWMWITMIALTPAFVIDLINKFKWKKWWAESRAILREIQNGNAYRAAVLDKKVMEYGTSQHPAVKADVEAWISRMEKLIERQEIWLRAMPKRFL